MVNRRIVNIGLDVTVEEKNQCNTVSQYKISKAAYLQRYLACYVDFRIVQKQNFPLGYTSYTRISSICAGRDHSFLDR